MENDNIHFEQLSLKQFQEDTFNVAKKFNAIMVTPEIKTKDTFRLLGVDL